MKAIKIAYILFAICLAALVSCDPFEGSQTVPSYLQIDGISVVDTPDHSWSQNEGFFSSQIDAVQITLYQEGDAAETILGTFQLPCKVPVLREGSMKYLRITPVVRQNGIASTRIYYPYYKEITINDVSLKADSTTSLGSLLTQYQPQTKVVWHEFFEPAQLTISLDTTVERIVREPDTVLSGQGCGVVRVKSDQVEVNFWTDTTFSVYDPSAYLYLELDYWSDFDFSVGMKCMNTNTNSEDIQSAMTIYQSKTPGWNKMYINLGRTWSWFNHYPTFRLYFTVFNAEGREGKLLLDNMKLLTI